MTLNTLDRSVERLKHSWHSSAAGDRDQLLDIARGIAILLVVVGHTVQGRSPAFDDDPVFRFIYSFHMPLFAMLAGASAAFWIKKYDALDSTRSLIAASTSRVRRAAVHLLIPFAAWTFIGYLALGSQEPVLEYMRKVFLRPDHSLWFLPCIFWCTSYAAVLMLGMSAARLHLQNSRFAKLSQGLRSPLVQALLMWVAWKLVARWLPPEAGLVFTNQFHGGLFVFFLIGAACYGPFVQTKAWWVRALPYLVFLGLVSFWHRTTPYNLAEHAPSFLSETGFRKRYAMVVALSGSLVFIDIARRLSSPRLAFVNRPLLHIGTASLGIYAVHFLFLNSVPPVIAPVAISLLIWHASSLAPPAAKVLFGK